MIIKIKTIDTNYLLFFIIFLLAIALIQTAWISDDAAITFRSILNFINGFGATFNIEERVQAYTHPLWFIILSIGTFVSGNIFYTTFFISISITLLTITILLKSIKNNYTLLLIGFSILLSKSFIDFSTSGLENPLSNLLIITTISLAKSQIKSKIKYFTFILSCSGIYLNRPDILIISLPLAILISFEFFKNSKEIIILIILGTLPIIIWTIFSMLYYGFPFPNTAYAKLGTGIALDERIIQGCKYFLHSFTRDPLTLFTIIIGIYLGLTESLLTKSLSIGILSYLIYILYIGGDFMEGRFLTAPFFTALIIIAMININESKKIFLIVFTITLGSLNLYSNLIAGSSYSNEVIYSSGIADERGFYFQKYGLLTAEKNTFATPHWNKSERKIEVVCGGLGFHSIKKGPNAHLIDSCALADPLLSRLPAKKEINWRIGHFYRQLPINYKESIEKNQNLLLDAELKNYWESIRIVTRGPLFSKKRFHEIIKLNFRLTENINFEVYKMK